MVFVEELAKLQSIHQASALELISFPLALECLFCMRLDSGEIWLWNVCQITKSKDTWQELIFESIITDLAGPQ